MRKKTTRLSTFKRQDVVVLLFFSHTKIRNPSWHNRQTLFTIRFFRHFSAEAIYSVVMYHSAFTPRGISNAMSVYIGVVSLPLYLYNNVMHKTTEENRK